MQRRILIALGANLTSPQGTPAQTLDAALVSLGQRGAAIRAVSRYYSTPAFPAGSGPEYVNAAAELCADWSPAQALDCLHAVEAEMGRTRGVRWGMRTLDLDLIAVEDAVLPDAQTHARWRSLPLDQQMQEIPQTLILPHPRLQERAFVLVPLADIAPDWVHPVLGASVRQMCDALGQDLKDEVRALVSTT